MSWSPRNDIVDQLDQLNAFSTDLQILIDRYVDEFDLSSASMTGVLAMMIRLLQDADIQRWHDEIQRDSHD